MNIKNELLIQPNIKFYTHEEIKKVFDNIIKKSNIVFKISNYTTKFFFRTEFRRPNDKCNGIKKDFYDWINNHDDSFKFEIMNGKIPIVKAHLVGE